MFDDWKYITWSDDSSFTLFRTLGWVNIHRMPQKAYNPECLVPTVEHGGGSVMILATMSWYSDVLIVTLNGQ